MRPTEAEFDGEAGIGLGSSFIPGGGIYKLKRGKKPPWQFTSSALNQLLWWTPEDSEPRLMWCNKRGQWFELDFLPVTPPSDS